MSVDFHALNIVLDVIFLASLIVQLALGTFILVRSSQYLPSRTAILVLLGGITFQLASYATYLADDVRRSEEIPYARAVSDQSFTFEIVEGVLSTLGSVMVLASVLILLQRSKQAAKNERQVGVAVILGAIILLAILGLDIGSVAFNYVTFKQLFLGLSRDIAGSQDLLTAYVVGRGISITELVMQAAFIVALIFGAAKNDVRPVSPPFLYLTFSEKVPMA